MVTLTKYGAKYNRNILFLEGLSTDTKPTGEFDGLSIQNGSEYTEVDTGKKFLFDYDNATWYEVQTGGGGGGGGTSNYNDLSNRPSVNNTVLTGNKTSAQLGLASSEQGGKADSAIQGVKLNSGSVITPDANNIVDITVGKADVGLGNVDNTTDLNKPISTATQTALNLKADKTEIPSVPITAIQKNGTGITPVSGTVNITVPTSAADVSALPDTTKYAAALSLTINSSTYVMTGQLKDQNGDNLGTAQTIDLPLESVVVGGSYNSQTKKVVLTLQNGNTIEFSVADLVSGLQTELSASNKLNPAYINYDSTHRAVSDTEKSTWNGKQNTIDSSHKLSADLVDDTSTTNKFATAAELEQIETNKNNISKIAPVTLNKRHIPQSADYEIISDLTISIPAGKKYLIHATAMFNNVAPKGVIINKTNTIATNKNTVFAEINGGETDYGGLTTSAIMSNTSGSAFDACIFAKYKSANASGSDVIVTYQDIT